MSKRMKWKNLRENKCPQCGKEFTDFTEPGYVKCKCSFVIRLKKLNEILDEMKEQENDSPDYGVDNVDNQQALNSF